MKKTLQYLSGIALALTLFLITGSQSRVYSQYSTSCTGTCRTVCNASEQPNGETCANATQDCCVASSTVDCAAQGGQCRATCLTPSQVSGDGACTTGQCCYPAPTAAPTCTTGSCKGYCNSDEISTGICTLNGSQAICCAAPEPTPTGTTQLCARNIDCNVNGCTGGLAWVQSEICPAYQTVGGKLVPISCAQASGCSSVGGGCRSSSFCTGCHPSSCTNTCNLGGCPGGCGNIDNCGGVSCGTAGCSGSTGGTGGSGGSPGTTGTPTSICGDTNCGGNETCSSCAADCGACPTSTPIPPPPSCGDLTCTAGTETCQNCATDCGACPVGMARALGKIIPSTATTCNDVLSSTDYVSTSIGINPIVAPGYQNASGGNYVSWTVPANVTYTMTPVTPTGLALKMACWDLGTGLSALVSANSTVSWQLGYTVGTPWFQAKEGDVYAQSGILYSPVGGTASPKYFALDGSGGTPGIVTFGGTDYDFSSDVILKGETEISTNKWLTNETFPIVDYYAIMYHRFGSPSPDYPGGTTFTSQPTSRPTPYYVNGDLIVDTNAWSVGNGQTITVLVNGDLTINKQINITGTGFVAFIVNGNIRISSSVGTTYASVTPVIEGIYITSTSGGIYTGNSTSAGARRFVGKGTFIGGAGVFPERDLDADSQNVMYAADLFIYNPELMLRMPDKMKDLPVSWQEVAP